MNEHADNQLEHRCSVCGCGRTYLTMEEAGAEIGRSAAYVKRHLEQTSGAPGLYGIPSPNDAEGSGPKTHLVKRAEWLMWVETFLVRLETWPESITTAAKAIPIDLMSPAQRRAATMRAGRAA
jgi:hypothetical protein